MSQCFVLLPLRLLVIPWLASLCMYLWPSLMVWDQLNERVHGWGSKVLVPDRINNALWLLDDRCMTNNLGWHEIVTHLIKQIYHTYLGKQYKIESLSYLDHAINLSIRACGATTSGTRILSCNSISRDSHHSRLTKLVNKNPINIWCCLLGTRQATH